MNPIWTGVISVFCVSCLLSVVETGPVVSVDDGLTRTIGVSAVPVTTDGLDWRRVKVGANPIIVCPSSTGTWRGEKNIVQRATAGGRIFQLLSALTIRKFQPRDADQYVCVEKNGTVIQSYTFYLDIIIDNTTEVQEVTAGSPMDLLCKVSGSDTITKTLLKNSTIYTDAVAKQDGFRWLRPVRAGDAGEYVCHVEQIIRGNTKAVDRPITLIVNYSPDMSKGEAYLDDVANGLSMGRKLRLQCPVSASPPALTSWVQVISDVSEVEVNINTTEVRLDEAKLIIPVAAGKKYGRFKCIATNSLGSIHQTFDVTSEAGLHTDVPFVTAVISGRSEVIVVWVVNGTVVGNASSLASEKLVDDAVASSSSATILGIYIALLALALMMAVAS